MIISIFVLKVPGVFLPVRNVMAMWTRWDGESQMLGLEVRANLTVM